MAPEPFKRSVVEVPEISARINAVEPHGINSIVGGFTLVNMT
jgi:hypothetical protein